MAQWEGEEGVKILSFFSFFKLKNDAFVFPRERKSKDEEIKKNGKKNHSSEHLLKKSQFFGEVELCG